ncbi:uncharacterized protein N7459_000339 [Penicillium hispanicum]|uniref:uncharacterized protein n=1 Tax=Penicillium hispanicum TaxID=1080232 RepID=UPI00253F6965|nr:uncharacterized protein N7459_000339 [Penicillium hispanicum]KAJ5594131.1 hypothetical protein N7459_000339 [Penicillium hispanicum]
MGRLSALLIGLTLLLHTSHATQFENFYPFYHKSLTTEENTPQCHDYYDAARAAGNTSDPNTCKTMVNCLFTNNGDINKADWSSALVLLGLTPTILGGLGPTIEEKAELLLHQPPLGLLCALAAPASVFGRPWVKPGPSVSTRPFRLDAFAHDARPPTPWVVAQYLLAAAAAANVLENVVRLGNQTVVSWKCTWTHLELAWALLALAPPLVALVPYLTRRPRRVVRRFLGRTKAAAGGAVVVDGEDGEDVRSGVFNSLANIAGAVQVIFGTLVLSSAMFIGTLDALGVVARFTASTLVGQLITMFALYGKDSQAEASSSDGKS